MRTHNTPRLCAGPQTAGTPIKFWNVASIGDDEGEITLYGDVVSRQPVDWWTGEPEPGLYIAPESFMEDLAAVKGKSNITIKINSCGGDLYTGIAIHNAIRGLTGHKVVVVEGIAASAASVIACAGDEVQVYPGSMVMIHGVAGLLYDYYTLADLKKLQKDFDASERAIAEIYHAKTGLEVDQLRSMMTRETWMVGQEAIDNGFADTLLTDEGPDVTLSADKKVLLVAGIRHDVKGFRHIPGTIPIDNSIHAAPAAGNKHAAAKNDGPKKEDNKTMTLEEMRAQHPDVVAQIEQQAAETARTQERARIEAIDSIAASVGDAQLVRDAKYGETPCTAEQLALKAMQKQAALGAKHLKDAKADNDESGAAGVGAAPNGGEEGSENDDKALPARLSRHDGDRRRQQRHRRQRPRAHQRPRRHGAYEDRPKFYYGEVGGTIRGKRLGELVRDYSRAFHTSVGELRRERLTDFLMEYYEAAEEAKRQRDKAASMPRNNFRKYRRRRH